MNDLNPRLGTPMNAKQYAKQWGENSKHFDQSQYYDWMASKVKGHRRILEIGCGTGFSTLALTKINTSKVFVIESNVYLAKAAKEFLKKHNVSASVTKVNDSTTLSSESKNKVEIIIGNISDDNIKRILANMNINCIVCWLIGADPLTIASSMSKQLNQIVSEDMAIYREAIHETCYSLGEQLLTEKGILHFVDRGGIRSADDIDQAKEHYSESCTALSNGNFKSTEVDIKVLQNTFQTSQLQYVSEQEEQPSLLILSSIISTKK